jgi:hypothetical protein
LVQEGNAKILAEKWTALTGIAPYLSHKKMLRVKEWYTNLNDPPSKQPLSNLIRQPAIGLQLALGEVVGQPGFNAYEPLMTLLLVSQVRTNSSIYLGV